MYNHTHTHTHTHTHIYTHALSLSHAHTHTHTYTYSYRYDDLQSDKQSHSNEHIKAASRFKEALKILQFLTNQIMVNQTHKTSNYRYAFNSYK